jgi:choline dehydrogenase-like flavoprotein
MTLFRSPSDLYNLASFYSGDSRACRSYEVFAVLQHPECLGSAFVAAPGIISLRANMPDTLRGDLQVAFAKIIASLGKAVDDSEFYDDLSLDTGAHYSATFPIGDTVSSDYRAFGFRNLFACGGAVLPETGYSNTGLTITAQALALADVIIGEYA